MVKAIVVYWVMAVAAMMILLMVWRVMAILFFFGVCFAYVNTNAFKFKFNIIN